MDIQWFRALIRALAAGHSRRRLPQVLGALAVSGPVAGLSLAETTAKRKRRKNKKKKRRKGGRSCPDGRPACDNGACCPPGELCVGGACVIGQGRCPAEADACKDASIYICGGVIAPCICVQTLEGETRCIQVITLPIATCDCTSSAQCHDEFAPGAICIKTEGPTCDACDPGVGSCQVPCLQASAATTRKAERRNGAGSLHSLP